MNNKKKIRSLYIRLNQATSLIKELEMNQKTIQAAAPECKKECFERLASCIKYQKECERLRGVVAQLQETIEGNNPYETTVKVKTVSSPPCNQEQETEKLVSTIQEKDFRIQEIKRELDDARKSWSEHQERFVNANQKQAILIKEKDTELDFCKKRVRLISGWLGIITGMEAVGNFIDSMNIDEEYIRDFKKKYVIEISDGGANLEDYKSRIEELIQWLSHIIGYDINPFKISFEDIEKFKEKYVIGRNKRTAIGFEIQNKFTEDLAYNMTAIFNMLKEKNESYGNSALEPARIFSKVTPGEGICVRIDDKLNRIIKGKEFPGDNDVDDLIGYFFLYKIWLKNQRNQTQEPQLTEVGPFVIPDTQQKHYADKLQEGTIYKNLIRNIEKENK